MSSFQDPTTIAAATPTPSNSVIEPQKLKMPRSAASIPINPKGIPLNCEWEECQFITVDMEDFIKHISEHLSTLISNVTPPEQVLGCFNCKWRNCGVAVIGHISDFTRHVYFHTFHTKIKSIGSMLIKTLALHACTLDGQSCNLIPDLPERLQCRWSQCGAIYDNPEFFYRHVDFHADDFKDGNNIKGGCECQWEGCDANVKSKHKLREHLRSHTQQKLVACPNCGGLFANRTKFFDHLERQTDVQWFQCSHCNKKFQTERLLRDHIRIHVNSYKCPLCEMTCPNPHGLRNHLLHKHTTERQFACPECEFKGKTQASLQRHMEIHSENVLMCHEKGCGFVSRLYQCLAAHYQKVHQGIDSRQYACHVCNQCFIRGTFLTKHLQKVHNYKWPPGYSRFRYTMHSDGYLRLQTVRYESVNLIEQVIDTDALSATSSENTEMTGDPETGDIPETAGNPEAADNPETASNPETVDDVLEMACNPETVDDVPEMAGNPEFAVVPEITGIPDMSENHPYSLEEIAENAGDASVPVATTSGNGGGGGEVSITYNLEMLGDVALLTPNKLGANGDVKQGAVTSSQGTVPGALCLEQSASRDLHCPDLMDPSTSSLSAIPGPQSMDVEVVHEEDRESDDDDHSDLFGIYSEMSSNALNSL